MSRCPEGRQARYLRTVEAADREWLRANRHRIKIGKTDDGRPTFDFDDDYNLYDATDDFLGEECVGFGEYISLRHWDNPTARETHEIVFVEPRFTAADLEALIATI